MRILLKLIVSGLALVATTSIAMAQTNYKVMTTKNDFESALFALENAIVNRGLVIDTVGHVGRMLERTSKATGGSSPYIGARYLGFCSAKLSARAMQADPDNLAVCPYIMFAYELKSEPGKARIGYRRPRASTTTVSKESIAAIEKLLDDILVEATQ